MQRATAAQAFPSSDAPPQRGTRLLLTALPGSGVRLLWQLLRGMQETHGGYRSFARAGGMATTARLLVDEHALDFPGAPELDALGRGGSDWHFLLPQHEVEVDVPLVFDRSSLVWATAPPAQVLRELPGTHERVYLLRDGRAVLDSLRRGPQRLLAGGARSSELYSRLDVFEACVRAWSRHVDSFLQHAGEFHLVRQEELVRDLPGGIERLASALGLPVDALRLAARVTPRTERRRSVRPRWRERFGPEHRGLFKAIAGETLIRLGYEEGYDW